MRKKSLLLVVLVMFFISCRVNQNIDKVVIEDFVVGAGYEVILVDGGPVERAKHGVIVTVVPMVLVDAGSHQLIVREKEIELNQENKVENENIELTINVELGKSYRLVKENGRPSLVIVGK